MSRQVLRNKPDDCRDEASVHDDDLDDDLRGILSSSWSPIPSQPDDDATNTAATLSSTTPAIGTMNDKTESSDQEQRLRLQTDDVPTEGGRQDQLPQLSSSSRLNPTMRPMTPPMASSDTLVHHSPSSSSSRHQHEHEHEQERGFESEIAITDDPSYPYIYHPINHRYYQSRYQYSYPGGSYYNTPLELDNHTTAIASAMGSEHQYHHHQTPYPSYYAAQDYGHYSDRPYDNQYSYYDSRGTSQDSSSSHPGPTRQYDQYYHPHHYDHGAATSPSSYHQTFPHGSSSRETTPSRVVTANTTAKDGTTPSSSSYTSYKSKIYISKGRKDLELSSSPDDDDDRKPSARSEKQADEKGRKGAVKRRRDQDTFDSYPLDPQQQQGQDFEPIPLNRITAIPILSSSSSSSRDIASSSISYGCIGGGGTIPYPHPTTSSCITTSPHEAAVVVDKSRSSSDAHVNPPRPRATTASTPASRKQPRILEPSSGGSNDTTSSTSWDKRFSELIDFKRVHGHCEVPQNYSENTSLGTWVNKQRMEQKNRLDGKTSSLTDSRFERLQAVGFRWAKRKGQASWDEKFNELKLYKAKFGNCHVPTKFKGNTALGRWVSTQRAEYKKYSEGVAKTSMNADKIRRLEEIGFAWFMAL